MSRKIPDELIIHAAELVKKGAKLQEAAALIGCNVDELSKKLRARGIKATWKRSRDDVPQKEVCRLYLDGLGTTALAKRFNSTVMVISGILRHNGIQKRNWTEANRIIAKNRTPLQNRAYIKKARETRTKNLIAAANSSDRTHPALGFGEREIAEILERVGHKIRKQTPVGGYLIDMTSDQIAMEIKTSGTSAHITKNTRKRFEEITKGGYTFVYIVVNHLNTIARHANDFVTTLNMLKRQPTVRGEYWVIRCTLEQIGSHTKVDHWSIERRSPNLPQTGIKANR